MNIVQMKVNEIAETMVPLYASCSSAEYKEIPSAIIWGPPGIGKSDIVREIGEQLKELTGKTVDVIDVRLLLFNPIDLRGIPTADANKETAKWLRPELFNLNPSKKHINIIFLDEISAAPPSVQAAAYQLTLDRAVGEHKLPDNTIIMAAGNRVTDKSVAYQMPKALANRFMHFEAICDVDDWKKWAIPNEIDSRIIGFINYKNTALFDFNPSKDDLAFPTPRSWSKVSNILDKIPNVNNAFPLIAGLIGIGAATEFRAYCQVYNELPNIDDILNGKEVEVPSRPDILYALSSSLVSHAAKANKTQLGNLLKFTMGISAEYSTLIVKDLIKIKKVQTTILMLPQWIEWSAKHKEFILD